MKNNKIIGAIALSYPPRVRVRTTVKLSAAFFNDESSITIGGGGVRKCNSAPCTQPNTSQCKLTRLARLASLGLPKLKLSSLDAPNVPRYGMSLIAN